MADAGVIGIPDDYAGEVPLAFIALRPATAANIAADTSGATEQAVRKSIFTVSSYHLYSVPHMHILE